MDPYCLTVHIYKDGKTIKKSTRLHRSQDSSLGRGMASEERDIFSSLAQFPNLVIVPLADVHWASQVIVKQFCDNQFNFCPPCILTPRVAETVVTCISSTHRVALYMHACVLSHFSCV